MKIVTIVGARPQFVKAAVVSRAITEQNAKASDNQVDELIVHTGQHFDENMSDVFFNQMNIPKPHYNLEINSLSHGAMTGKMLEKIEEVLLKEKPDWVLVYGDTNSTLAGALAAKKLHIKIAHVEAGLRSFNMQMPEEINRILTDRISDILFCPTQTAIDNLKNEGYDAIDIEQVKCGDVMFDAAMYYKSQARKPEELNIDANFVLSTIHRQENTDNPEKLAAIFDALTIIAKKKKVVLPMHPRTLKKLDEYNIVPTDNIIILKPVGYFEMIWMLSNCELVITDSGGLQKEAFFFKKPCITVRDQTEWVELLESKVNFLTGHHTDRIIETYELIQNTQINFDLNLYGIGKTGESIVKELSSFAMD